MPLTKRQRKEQARAELEALIANLMSARRQADATAAKTALEALITFNTAFSGLER